MDTATAFIRGELNRSKPLKVFDWHKAARLINERKAQFVGAGLAGDLEWTSGDILRDGKPVSKDDTYTYLASTWATPVLLLDDELIDCYVTQNEANGWDADTFWPESALSILRG